MGSEGKSPFATHQSNQSHPFPQRSQSTPGQIFGNNNNENANPFDDDFDDDPFADDNPNNPFNNPFKINIKNDKRTDATQQEVQQKRSKTPEPEMAAIQFKTDKNAKKHNRRHSQPVNNHISNNLDEIFSDFQPPKLVNNGKLNLINSSHSPSKTKTQKNT